jgi:sortase (surface protein transpeptidase)
MAPDARVGAVSNSGRHRRSRRRRIPALLIAGTVAALAAGVYFGVQAAGSRHPATSAEAAPAQSSASALTYPPIPIPIPGVTPSTSASSSASVGVPVRLVVPSIGINTTLQSLALLSNGTLQPPSSWNVAGWYSGGIRPGQIGPAVIAGHIDSTSGPAVFYKLHTLAIGAQAIVTEQDGTTLTFVVDDIQSYPKDDFPATAVYGPTPYPELRLITCTGDFDYKTHNYLDNLVVSTHLVTGGTS